MKLPKTEDLTLVLAACLALVAPTLLAFNLPPSATFLNQAAALVGWGAFLVVLVATVPQRRRDMLPGELACLMALAVLVGAALAAPVWAGLPWSLAFSAVGMILAAALTLCVAGTIQASGSGDAALRAFCIGLVVAGLFSSAIGMVQVFAPGWADGDWIARTYLPGRAVGNLRQPNHVSSLLVWAAIAVVWLADRGVIRRGLAAALGALFVFAIVLTGSRTGTLSVILFAVWAGVDRRLSKPVRILLALAPVVYLVGWFGMSAWADYGHHVFGGETRFSARGDISSSRWAIWSNTLALIRMHPWAGAGFGEFNFAWTLTPFPDRPVAFFDHTHDLLLQFAVELGLPLATLVTGLLGYALCVAWRHAAREPARRAALVMMLMILLHSLLEYPLWYAYFLLPAMFAFGLCLGPVAATAVAARSGNDLARAPAAAARVGRPALLIGSILLLLGGIASVFDYHRVVVIFAPPEDAPPLAQRISDGERSLLFAHQADYAAATTAHHPADAIDAFKGASHNLLDARLMIAWSKALAESGDVERARYVAARLKEFRNDYAAEFFAPCKTPPPPGTEPPFQCTAPVRALTYADFR